MAVRKRRKDKDFKKAGEIRNKIKEKRYKIDDVKKGAKIIKI